MHSLLRYLALAVAIVILAGCGSDADSSDLDIGDLEETGLSLGTEGPELKVYENFACESCADFSQQVLPQLVDDYVKSGKLHLVFAHAPVGTGAEEEIVHKAAQCAAEQNKFWEFQKDAFAEQDSLVVLGENELTDLANDAGVETSAFEQCLNDGADAEAKVNSDLASLQALAPGYQLQLPTLQLGQSIMAGSTDFEDVAFFLDENLGQAQRQGSDSTLSTTSHTGISP